MYSYRSASRETEKLPWVAFHLWENSAQLSHINSSGKVCYAGYWKVNFRWQGSKDSNLNNDQNNMQLNIYKKVYWFCGLYYINDKNCSVPYSCHFVKKCLVAIKRKTKKKRKERMKERKKRLILLKNIFKNKTSEIKSSCQHSGQQLSHSGSCLKLYCTWRK